MWGQPVRVARGRTIHLCRFAAGKGLEGRGLAPHPLLDFAPHPQHVLSSNFSNIFFVAKAELLFDR